ncbi:MAG: VacJ family lipoprotein [Gammaproteobacteria bacterium]
MSSLVAKSRRNALVIGALVVALLSGCASTPREPDTRETYDPFEPLNRKVWAFNQAADRMVLRPIARGYDTVVPQPAKWGIANVFDNLSTPLWALNHLLQGDVLEAGKQTGRFVLNSTLGLLGIWDPAGDAGLQKDRASFDQTFGKWGIPSGPFVMLPFLGPSSVRGGVGIYARYETDIVWNRLDDNRSLRDKLVALEIIDTRRRLLPLDNMIERAPDSYIFVREAYRQRSEYSIRGPGRPDDDVSLDFEDEDWGDDWEDYPEEP